MAKVKRVVRRRERAAEAPVEAIEVVSVVEDTEDEAAIGDAPPGSPIDDIDRIIRKYRERATTPLKAIRAKCVECMGGSIAEVGRCTSALCTLHPFRMGKNTLHALAKKEGE